MSRRYRRTKKYNPENRMLRKNCSVHGELVGYTSSYDNSPVYESLNLKLNKVEHKCFLCLEEPLKKESEHNRLIHKNFVKEGHKRYGRKENFFESIGNFFLSVCFFGSIATWFFTQSILKAFVLAAISFVVFVINYRLSARFESQRTAFIKENTKHLKPVSNAREIVKEEVAAVNKWRIEQAQLRKEEEKRKIEEKLAWLKNMNYSLSEVDEMDGRDFEIFVKYLLDKNGYENTQITKASGDHGADIITYKKGKKIAVQCKRHKGNISNSAVQEVHSAKSIYSCAEAYVITNSYFTQSAIETAHIHQVKLINREELFRMLEKAKNKADVENREYQVEFNFDD